MTGASLRRPARGLAQEAEKGGWRLWLRRCGGRVGKHPLHPKQQQGVAAGLLDQFEPLCVPGVEAPSPAHTGVEQDTGHNDLVEQGQHPATHTEGT
ncbi:hypothetical protein ANANG_G00254520 [Anguilla anguilla]|uniref:Uncharacterized protein n=1 Tax=Anguilla anguilla TaxID=7936 RepID=A0A9D3LSW3_ANGAN|nr:hypothetical protein ANANG_G00254520 [Anguilla anguilla]